MSPGFLPAAFRNDSADAVKAPWCIDLLNLNLNNPDPGRARQRIDAYFAALERDGLRRMVKVIVGGAPVNEAFANAIGANAYGYDAANAVERVRGLIG